MQMYKVTFVAKEYGRCRHVNCRAHYAHARRYNIRLKYWGGGLVPENAQIESGR